MLFGCYDEIYAKVYDKIFRESKVNFVVEVLIRNERIYII